MTEKKYRVHDWVKFQYSEIGEYIDENHTDRPLRNDIIVDLLNELDTQCSQLEKNNEQLKKENEQLKKENHELKAILQDMGMLMSDEEIVNIRNEIADKFLKPLLNDNGFNVDVDTSNGFTIIPRGDVE